MWMSLLRHSVYVWKREKEAIVLLQHMTAPRSARGYRTLTTSSMKQVYVLSMNLSTNIWLI